jgi:hypothetical protein
MPYKTGNYLPIANREQEVSVDDPWRDLGTLAK